MASEERFLGHYRIAEAVAPPKGEESGTALCRAFTRSIL